MSLNFVTLGSPENASCVEQLTKVLQLVTSNCEQISIATYRHMFTEKPSLFQLFPFHTDDWNKISYMDYTGTYPEQQADSWFVVCRYVSLFPFKIFLTMCHWHYCMRSANFWVLYWWVDLGTPRSMPSRIKN